ncbi:helix-turn-helix transcriptional regulator [Kurthia sibirica]|uniref:HTH luxR-type domain-containing protein n=1 Tax=Kurthia sibirica TaxID=202750 RepID=A0A2U3AQ65_9BACL|nr:LuxR C-terminal-related transcriptional regulator [Kurthia sibirica]PWI26682.1 hypothetical protein DEX24_02690 [Kurthia sibirica]GEK32951.1 hypothetical protein KSI01_04840 [Kurthia sibirica]
MNNQITYTQFVLFCKVHAQGLRENIHAYISINDAPKLLSIELSFLQLFSEQKVDLLQENYDSDINIWLQSQKDVLTIEELSLFRYIFEQSIFALLIQNKNTEFSAFTFFLSDLFIRLSSCYNHFHQTVTQEHSPSHHDKKTQQLIALNAFSACLIAATDATSSLPALLHDAESIFSFKRCVFYAYNPWLNEYHGVYGAELMKVQSMRGKLADHTAVFSERKPIFLKDPTHYLPASAIELFQLSSIVFTPVCDKNKQLYGWLTFDQLSEEFDMTKDDLEVLAQAANLLAQFLGRKASSNVTTAVQLTEKEKIILTLLADGLNNKQMAELLFLSPHTIRDYIERLMHKLHAKNRTQVISTAFRLSLIT